MSALQLAFLNVGQGDTTIIYDPDSSEAVVVDCVNPIPVFEFLEANGINRLRALILTHAHADHYLGVADLLDNCERRGIHWDIFIFRWEDSRKIPSLLTDRDGHSEMVGKKRLIDHYRTLTEWARRPEVKRRHIQHTNLPRDARILRALDFLHPEHQDWQELFDTGNLNNLSIVIRVSDGASALLTGDIEPEGWKFLCDNHPGSLPNAVLKFPHHGVWRNGDVSELLTKVSPQFVIVSVGTANTYGHPSTEVFAEVGKYRDIRLLCTQATPQCCKGIGDVRDKILKTLERGSSIAASPSNRIGSGCPCAGTVIVELGESAKVISPSLEMHVSQIIVPYMNSYRCNIDR